jgi:A/G-specific adenine glycosylase
MTRSDMQKTPKLSSAEVRRFQKEVYDHYKLHRRKLPWRETHDPYKILLSELMLQQTQVKRVIEKYEQFLRRFPDIVSVANAPLRAILEQWQGLGYNRRSLALKELAAIVVDRYGGRIPSAIEALKALPGVGGATAGAVCAFAFNRPSVFIETNIRSVFIHRFFRNRRTVTDREILPLIAQTLDEKKPREWYYALMDYGVALKEQHTNPSRRSAHYTRQSPFEGSLRQVRGKIIKTVVAQPGISEAALIRAIGRDTKVVRQALEQLRQEGFIIKAEAEGGPLASGPCAKGSRFFIPEK